MFNFSKRNKAMVTELKEVITAIEQLKDEEQRQIAKMLRNEMNWDITLQNNQDKLVNLAQEALTEYKTGKTKQTDW